MQRGWLCAAGVVSCIGYGGSAAAERVVSDHAAVDPDPLCIDPGRYMTTPELVIDKRHDGRIWQRRASERLPQAEAASYCADLVIEGIGGFHLPTPQELGSLRYKAGGLFGGRGRHYCIPSIDQAAFPETPAAEFWTSRVMPDGTAWYMGFDDGRMHRSVVNDTFWVRCVRDGG
ncbi:Hypothetical protein A7982_10201 [Minicystis rosea]|nr:Hypothetical protein A7982_10201 [Minicystis rosea]